MSLFNREALRITRDASGAWVITLNERLIVRFRGEDAAVRAERYFEDLWRIAGQRQAAV